jgi:hypothetical protein
VITNAVSHLSTPDRRHWVAIPPERLPPRVTTPDPPADTSPPPAKRARGPTKRLAEATNQQLEAQAGRLAVKDKKRRREEARSLQVQMDATVECAGDDDEVRRLKGE